jgi:hypothetical protein
MTRSRGINQLRAIWNDEQIEQVRTRYPHEKTEKIACDIGMTIDQVFRKAAALRLNKTEEYLSSPDACRLRREDSTGVAYRFSKGHAPFNKGIKGISYPGCEATQFKKGQKSHSWKPIGSERLMDGYRQRKISDTGYPPRDWKGIHVLLWERHHGPVPKNHMVIFKDADKNNIVIENLECITLADNMRRNSIHNLPQELKEVLQLKGALNRRITCHERHKRT